jgi:hypothetical protein
MKNEEVVETHVEERKEDDVAQAERINSDRETSFSDTRQ